MNADGFGFGAGATQAIFDVIGNGGLVTSISVNVNFPDAVRTAELISAYPNISVGVHLNPIAGAPCLPPDRVPTLVGTDGLFYGKKFGALWRRRKISSAELEYELDAQIARARDLAGDHLTHMDSHRNLHLAYFDIFLKLARKWKIPYMRNNASLICLESERPRACRRSAYLRRPHVFIAHCYRRLQMAHARRSGIKMADKLITVGYAGLGNKADMDNWKRILENLPAGTYEIYCHPAYPDETLRRWASYCEPRIKEFEILRSGELLDVARKNKIELISFFDLI